MDPKKEIEALVKKRFGIIGDHPFKDDEDDEVFRHEDNGKWFALLMKIPNKTLSLEPSEGFSYLLNVKGNPKQIPLEFNETHFHPAYHMNKRNWISVLLDKDTPMDKTLRLLKVSFRLTKKKKRIRPGSREGL